MEWKYTEDGALPSHLGQVLVSFTLCGKGPSVEAASYASGRWDFGSPSTNPNVAALIFNWWDGDVSDDPYYARYRETFHIPQNNPRWESGLASYVYVLDLASGNVTKLCNEHTEAAVSRKGRK
jgi:hypothetical protein